MQGATAYPVLDAVDENQLMSANRVAAHINRTASDPGVRLSDPTLRWIAALYDTRQCLESAAAPLQTAYSEKTTMFCRGQFNTGTTGFGYAIVSPTAAADLTNVTVTGASSVGVASTVLSAYTVLTNVLNNSSYSNSSFVAGANSLQGKVTAITLYVRYAGTVNNMGGDYLLVEEPNHNDLNANYSYNSCLAMQNSKRVPISKEWVSVSYTPNSIAELAFGSSSRIPGVNANYILGIMVSSALAGMPFEFEMHAKWEINGAPARASTITFEDVIGASLVMSAANMCGQLDCSLGLDGFMAAIHAQAQNLSTNLIRGAPRGNWAGLLPLLPKLASLVLPSLATIGGKLLKSLGKKKPNEDPVGVIQAKIQRLETKKRVKKEGKALKKIEKKAALV